MTANGNLLTKPHSSCRKFVLYVPKQLTNLVFEAFHESYLSGGHVNWRKTKSARSDTVARALLTECVLRYGAMTKLMSDNATTFTSNALGEFCELHKIQHHKAILYH
ncbi:hypothetical protein B9Z55_028145 [Caenorhabditis nigoni]|uniref:Integrase catalytic domain-containing protein n=1 Tax=Caenorhabditis nigoni TaxID=1611254 RepID=A0A2G5SCZ7_9PELO|nr:hypothetical protein B9Z55_028145 [Caenorhabditis nigoni]